PGDQLTNRRHFLRLYQLLLETTLVGRVLEEQDRVTRRLARHRHGGHEVDAVALPELQGGAPRAGQGPRYEVRPIGWEQAHPGPARQGGHGDLHQLGEHPVAAAHDALGVDDADGVADGVHGQLPLALAAGEQLHETGVDERDGGHRHHRRGEVQFGGTIGPGTGSGAVTTAPSGAARAAASPLKTRGPRRSASWTSGSSVATAGPTQWATTSRFRSISSSTMASRSGVKVSTSARANRSITTAGRAAPASSCASAVRRGRISALGEEAG